MNDSKSITITVPEDVNPCRIDIYLVQQGIGLSRNQIQKLIRSGNISVVNKGTKPNFILRGGETILIEIPEREPFKLIPEDIPIDIVYEDEYMLVVNKPPGMVTHPARGNWTGTLLNAVLYHTNQLSPIGGDYRPGVVHRLDKDTSGLLIVAKRAQVHTKLSRMLSTRKIHREYLALLWGHLPEKHWIVDAAIGRNPADPLKKAVVPDGRRAKTEFFHLNYFDFLHLVRAKLYTGRTHQIRVHSAHIGHNVFGDYDYGGREERIGGIHPRYRNDAKELLELAPRQMLHAYKLEFTHPVLGNAMTFRAQLPQDFSAVLERLG
ncbi:RNA pseudouridine synthase, partial [bacterium]